MPHSFGKRARTRDKFSKAFKTKGMPGLSRYLATYKRGDYVGRFFVKVVVYIQLAQTAGDTPRLTRTTHLSVLSARVGSSVRV